MNNRRFSLLVPWFMDGALALVQTAVPLLALRLGASAFVLSSINWIAQSVRLPICFAAGPLSERVSRTRMIVPAALAIALAAVGFVHAKTNAQVVLLYTVCLASIGVFYPTLQAMIGDVSRRGELTKNLGAFNIGWCIGGSLAALGAGWVVGISLPLAFYVAAGGFALSGALVVAWGRIRSSRPHDAAAEPAQAAHDTGPLLIIARMGHYMGFFSYAIVRFLFPKLGKAMHWSDSTIALVVAWIIVGQGAGMLATYASPWWRGRLWPQVTAQLLMLGAALTAWRAASPFPLGAAFFCMGLSLSVAYTTALYHGLSNRTARGRNTGIHEGIVAAGGISGSLLGGIVAEEVSLRAPFILVAFLAGAILLATILLRSRWNAQSSADVSGTGR